MPWAVSVENLFLYSLRFRIRGGEKLKKKKNNKTIGKKKTSYSPIFGRSSQKM